MTMTRRAALSSLLQRLLTPLVATIPFLNAERAEAASKAGDRLIQLQELALF